MKNKLKKIKTTLVVTLCLVLTLFVVACSTTQYQLSYTAGTGGTITGEVTQTVDEGKDGSEVIAVANSGYVFVKWSDGLTTATRTDKNVQKNLSVTAEFRVDEPGLDFQRDFVGSWVKVGSIASSSQQIIFDYQEESGAIDESVMLSIADDYELTCTKKTIGTTNDFKGRAELHSKNIYKIVLNKVVNPTATGDVYYFTIKEKGYLHLIDSGTYNRYDENQGALVFAKIPPEVSSETNADGSEKPSSFFYNVNNDKIEITKYVGVNKNVKIPAQIDGKNVEKIGKDAFAFSNVESIDFGSSVQKIATRAFYDCTNLLTLDISSNINAIDSAAFMLCTNLASVEFAPNEQLTKIGDRVFSNCYALESITIPSCVTTIGNGAFNACSNLLSITFDERSENIVIGSTAFSHCAFVDLVVPSFVTSIGSYAFSGCIDLQSVTFEQNCQLTKIESNLFSGCEKLESITIPSSVKTIGEGAFFKCYKLADVEFDEDSQLEKIERYAFFYCRSLTEFSMPSSVVSVNDTVFSDCFNLSKVYITDLSAWCNIDFEHASATPMCYGANLYLNGEKITNLVIPNGVTSIGAYTFYGLWDLESVEIPASVTSIGVDAFDRSANIKKVYITDLSAWCNMSFANSGANPMYYVADLYLNGEKVTNLVIPDDVTDIAKYAFYNCSSITNIDIHADVKSIGGYAFCGIGEVTEIKIENGVTSIGEYAFSYCPKLKSIIIPSSVTTVDQYALSYSFALSIYCEATSQPNGWNSDWNVSGSLVYWYSSTQPTTSGSYWHYVNGVPTVWVVS